MGEIAAEITAFMVEWVEKLEASCQHCRDPLPFFLETGSGGLGGWPRLRPQGDGFGSHAPLCPLWQLLSRAKPHFLYVPSGSIHYLEVLERLDFFF